MISLLEKFGSPWCRTVPVSMYLYNVTVKQRLRCLRPGQLEPKHTSYEILECPATDDGK